MNILVTGGAGYIGSHTCVQLLESGHNVVVVDNLSNSKRVALDRVVGLTGKDITFVEADIRDGSALERLFRGHAIDTVLHFAGLKAVGESTQIPIHYYDNNVAGTVTLLKAMEGAGVRSIVFSSSATVYGDPHAVPILESFPRSATNPYGWSKLMIEHILEDLSTADPRWSITMLRYFNPVGAHPSGEIGEDPTGIPNNLLPYISQVAVGTLEKLRIFGNDYPTPDGTGIRDYIHVVDLADGHLAALNAHASTPGLFIYNLGTGQGVSVLEMHAAFEKTCEKPVAFEFVDRRPGDIAQCYADPTKANAQLGWKTKRSLADITNDAWRWQTQNPKGYEE